MHECCKHSRPFRDSLRLHYQDQSDPEAGDDDKYVTLMMKTVRVSEMFFNSALARLPEFSEHCESGLWLQFYHQL
jgi:hypothetical protein